MSAAAARRGSVYSGLALTALGVAALVFAQRYETGRLAAPGPGFFPQIGAALLAVSGAVAAVRSFVETPSPSDTAEVDAEPATLQRAIWTIVVLIFFAAIFEWAGFFLATPPLLAATAWLAGAGPRSALVTAIVGTAAFYWLFAKVLSSQVPAGLLGA